MDSFPVLVAMKGILIKITTMEFVKQFRISHNPSSVTTIRLQAPDGINGLIFFYKMLNNNKLPKTDRNETLLCD